jgi:acetyl-CoA carboxylase carboxyltransferase component
MMRMTWKPELDELMRRESFAREMGGADKVKRQHDGGRLTVRERIERLVDPASFHEVGAIAGVADYDASGGLMQLTPANCLFGRGLIDGRPVVVVGDDFTVRGGSADASIAAKPLMAEEMACEFRLPIIRIIEGSGGGGSVKTIETRGASNLPGGVGGTRGFYYMTANMAQVPVVALGLGSVAGLGAARLVSSHYSIMTKSSAMFVAGPPVVARLGQQLEKQELGGWEIQTRSGAVDHAVDTEDEAFACARRFLSYLPASVHALSATLPCHDDPERADEFLMNAIPRNRRQVYKMRPIIEAIVDKGAFFEMGQHFGRAIIAGLARFDGRAVLLLASDPYHYGGSWTADTCQKVTRFVDLAETFHLPVVYLCDCPGFMIGADAERSATIRHGARAMAAINQTTVPWCTVIVRNAFGVAGAAHQPAGRLSLRYAWLSAYWGSLPLEGGVEAAYRAEIDAAEDPKAKLAEIEERLNKLRSPFRSAERFWVEEIIDPRKTRPLLCEFARLAEPVRKPGVASFVIRP